MYYLTIFIKVDNVKWGARVLWLKVMLHANNLLQVSFRKVTEQESKY